MERLFFYCVPVRLQTNTLGDHISDFLHHRGGARTLILHGGGGKVRTVSISCALGLLRPVSSAAAVTAGSAERRDDVFTAKSCSRSGMAIKHGLQSPAERHLLLSASLVVGRDYSQNKVQTG